MKSLHFLASVAIVTFSIISCNSSKNTTKNEKSTRKKDPAAAEAAVKIGKMLDLLATDLIGASGQKAEIIRTAEGINITFQPDFYFESSSEHLTFISTNVNHPTLQKAAEELQMGFAGLLGTKTNIVSSNSLTGGIILETSSNQALTNNLSSDGFAIFSRKGNIIITSKSESGVLYGAFELLRRIQTGQSLS